MTVLLSFIPILGKAHQLEWIESFRQAASEQAVARYKLLFLHSRDLNLQEITADILELRKKYEVLKKDNINSIIKLRVIYIAVKI